MQIAAEKKYEAGKETFAQKENGKVSSKRGKKTAVLSRPVRFSNCQTSLCTFVCVVILLYFFFSFYIYC